MDPLSITSGVIAIIQIASTVISICKDYISTVQDAPRDLLRISMEVGGMKCVLETIELLASTGDRDVISIILPKLQSPDGPLEGCKEALTALNQLLSPAAECPTDGKRRKLLLSLRNLAWPLKETKARKLLEDIGRYKGTISLALTTETLHDIKNINRNVEELRNAFNDHDRESILKWLVATDPSSNHNRACDLHEPHTGKWLTRSPEYQNWVNGSARFLWLHGIPGSGKTILASHIIEAVKQSRENFPPNRIASAYYYCYFQREQDESPHLLRWVINQLCRQSGYIPKEVRALYDCGGEPSLMSLMIAFSAVLCKFDLVYLVVDALDESLDRQNLLDTMAKIATDDEFRKVRLMALSRKEIEIEKALGDISTSVSLSNPWVDEDIRLYIQNRLQTSGKLGRRPKALRDEIEKALVSGANGMFRWTFCQLDILERLNSASEIRKALCELPETLDETYERILTNIPDKNRKYAHKALQLLAFGAEIDTLAELAEAVVVNEKECFFDPNDRFLDPKDLIEICTCLITYNEGKDPEVQLAHYSVQEYLVSERVKPVAFHISHRETSILAARICITYLLSLDYEVLLKVEDYTPGKPDYISHHLAIAEDAYPLSKHAFLNWDAIPLVIEKADLISDFILKLLNPCELHFNGWMHQTYGWYYRVNDFIFPRWTFNPGAEVTVTIAYACFFGIILTAQILLEEHSDLSVLENELELQDIHRELDPKHIEFPELACGTLLHIAAALAKPDFVGLLIEKGAKVNTIAKNGVTPLHSAVEWYDEVSEERLQVLKQLVHANALLDPPCMAETPLQAAVRKFHDISIIQYLLDAGADVDGVGDDGAIITRIRDDWERGKGDPDLIEEMTQNRGETYYYDTPLRIAENLPCRPPFPYREEAWMKILDNLKELLKSYGAKSLHLFPVKNLPGYVEADMKAIYENCKEEVHTRLECDEE